MNKPRIIINFTQSDIDALQDILSEGCNNTVFEWQFKTEDDVHLSVDVEITVGDDDDELDDEPYRLPDDIEDIP